MNMPLLQQRIFDAENITNVGQNLGKTFTSSDDFSGLINQLIAYAFLAAGILSVAFIFWGGIKLILSGGEDEKIKSAIGTIRHSIIGLLVTIFSFAAVAFIGGVFGLDLVGYISVEKIWEFIADLTAN